MFCNGMKKINPLDKKDLPTPMFANLVLKTCSIKSIRIIKTKAGINIPTNYQDIRFLTLKPVSPGLK